MTTSVNSGSRWAHRHRTPSRLDRDAIFVISARGREEDKIQALDAGASDSVTKPFGVGELLARIGAGLRSRAQAPGAPAVFLAAICKSTCCAVKVHVQGREVHLTPINTSCSPR
jgi:two-component system KDP operon response regulator KdpE